MADETTKTIKIRQVRSIIGTKRRHREVLKSLGLRRIRHVVERPDTPAVRGMVNKIPYLVEILEDQDS
jgi:large subunit ribosomal protein L30